MSNEQNKSDFKIPLGGGGRGGIVRVCVAVLAVLACVAWAILGFGYTTPGQLGAVTFAVPGVIFAAARTARPNGVFPSRRDSRSPFARIDEANALATFAFWGGVILTVFAFFAWKTRDPMPRQFAVIAGPVGATLLAMAMRQLAKAAAIARLAHDEIETMVVASSRHADGSASEHSGGQA